MQHKLKESSGNVMIVNFSSQPHNIFNPRAATDVWE